MTEAKVGIGPSQVDRFHEDGVICIRNALNAEQLKRLEVAYNYSMSHPGPGACSFYPETGAVFYQDGSNTNNWSYYREFLKDLPLADLAAALWKADDVWFMNEQIFLKEGGSARRTPWHQDSSYTPYAGEQLAIMWINFDPVPKEDSLEFVRGSHHGPLYNGTAFDPADDTAPAFANSDMPRLPDIQAEREKWDIISFAVEPGDIVIFHNQVLHGGGATHAGARRRTLSLRFFGGDVVREQRGNEEADSEKGQIDTELLAGWGDLIGSLEPGQPLHARSEFFRVRPFSQAA